MNLTEAITKPAASVAEAMARTIDRPRPTIVCLCGSTRFYQAFMEANYRETMGGKIVLSVGFYPHAVGEMHGEGVGCTDPQKVALDALHFRKIELADEVLVLNCPRARCAKCLNWLHNANRDGRSDCCLAPYNMEPYVGDSTRREIDHARSLGKPLRFLSEEPHALASARPADRAGDSPE